MSATGVYGGDEVGAIVIDIGSNTIRAGFAGEDMPKADIPTMVGVGLDVDERVGAGGEGGCMDLGGVDEGLPDDLMTRKRSRYYIDTVNIKVPRANVELKSFLQDGLIEDWDMFEGVIEYIYAKSLRSSTDAHPLLLSEPTWNTRAKREKLTELMFETYNVPAFYLCKNAVLSAFASGRSTGLVLDSGAAHSTAVPVYDGYVLHQGVVRTAVGGDSLVEECRKLIESLNVEIIPKYLVANKEPVGEGEPAKWTRREGLGGVTRSYHEFCVRELLQDFIHSIIPVSDDAYDKEIDAIESTPHSTYEMPNGYHQKFGVERFKIGETLFNPAFRMAGLSSAQSIDQIVTSSISQCDIDIRPSLVNSVIVCGGNSLLTGFSDRLSIELAAKLPPSMRLKLISSSTSNAERRFSSWIGGSILASLGSFQQLWLSKLEYEESGRGCIEKKCP